MESIIPCRPDEAVTAHIDLIDGMIFDASQEYIEFIDAAGGLNKLLPDKNELINECQSCEFSPNGSNSEDDTEAIENLDDTESNQDDAIQQSTACIACERGDMPSGAHCCIKCQKAVHVLDGCSKSCGSEEGYGEQRICNSCATKPTRVTAAKESLAKKLNQPETWKPKASKRSYLIPVRNWNIDQRVQSKPKISMLSNASLSTTTYTVNKKKVALRNTCGPDAFLQVKLYIYQ